MIKTIKVVGVPVKDQDRALKFYTEKLGFELVTDQPFEKGGQRWIELAIPGAETHLALYTPKGHESRIGTFSSIGFTASSVKKTYKDLSAKGVRFAHAPKEEPWGVVTIMMDPDGNQFSLSSKN